MFNSVYKNKVVLVTGNTGFKGSWLTSWLLRLGAKVVGISRDIPTSPSMFEVLNLESKIEHHYVDICDTLTVGEIIGNSKPNFIFHLAAQPLVSVSYEDPIETINTNVMGTVSILNALRGIDSSCVAVMITSDKCYDNVEWAWGYKETDSLGGKDIYSGSKGAAELVIKSFFHSFLLQKENIRLGIGRAGNVIGGGDWARDRLVVDCMVSWSEGDIVEIRSPNATRPWQHVLEPLSGYLTLGSSLLRNRELDGEAFNFGPNAFRSRTVSELLRDLSKYWNYKKVEDAFEVIEKIPFHEAGLLKLNCDKATMYLDWQPNLSYELMIKQVGSWYHHYYSGDTDMISFTDDQIAEYEKHAFAKALRWAIV